MTDDESRWLREQLDHELAGVHSDPQGLDEVLGRGPARRSARPPAWFLAAAAVLVVVLAVPVLGRTPFARHTPPDRLASAPLPAVTEPATSEPTTAGPTDPSSPSPAPSPGRTTPPGRPTPPPPVVPPSATTGPCPTLGVDAGTTTVPADLDGDGRPDAVYAIGGTLAVRLSGSGTATAPLDTGSPYVLVLPVETDATAGSELLVVTRGGIGTDGTVGRLATLWDVHGCTLAPVLNARGTAYAFEVGASAAGAVRAGVACDGTTLVGVTSTRAADGTWTVTRTPVSSATGRARNGTPTVTAGAPDAAALQDVTCGPDAPHSLD